MPIQSISPPNNAQAASLNQGLASNADIFGQYLADSLQKGEQTVQQRLTQERDLLSAITARREEDFQERLDLRNRKQFEMEFDESQRQFNRTHNLAVDRFGLDTKKLNETVRAQDRAYELKKEENEFEAVRVAELQENNKEQRLTAQQEREQEKDIFGYNKGRREEEEARAKAERKEQKRINKLRASNEILEQQRRQKELNAQMTPLDLESSQEAINRIKNGEDPNEVLRYSQLSSLARAAVYESLNNSGNSKGLTPKQQYDASVEIEQLQFNALKAFNENGNAKELATVINAINIREKYLGIPEEDWTTPESLNIQLEPEPEQEKPSSRLPRTISPKSKETIDFLRNVDPSLLE
jgi:hypothetical protein